MVIKTQSWKESEGALVPIKIDLIISTLKSSCPQKIKECKQGKRIKEIKNGCTE